MKALLEAPQRTPSGGGCQRGARRCAESRRWLTVESCGACDRALVIRMRNRVIGGAVVLALAHTNRAEWCVMSRDRRALAGARKFVLLKFSNPQAGVRVLL